MRQARRRPATAKSRIGAVPLHGAEHACRGIIPLVAVRVHMRKRPKQKQKLRSCGFFCARAAGLKSMSAACCDHGQSYCAGSCAQEARVQAQRAASRRYQESRRGRLNHAARTARHHRAMKSQPMGPGRVKTRSDLVVMPCGARIFAFIRSPCAHTPQKSW